MCTQYKMQEINLYLAYSDKRKMIWYNEYVLRKGYDILNMKATEPIILLLQ